MRPAAAQTAVATLDVVSAEREKPAVGEWCFSPALVLILSEVSRVPFLVSRRVRARVAVDADDDAVPFGCRVNV